MNKTDKKDIPNSCKSVFSTYVKCQTIRKWNPFLEEKHCDEIKEDLDECIRAFSPSPIFIFGRISDNK